MWGGSVWPSGPGPPAPFSLRMWAGHEAPQIRSKAPRGSKAHQAESPKPVRLKALQESPKPLFAQRKPAIVIVWGQCGIDIGRMSMPHPMPTGAGCGKAPLTVAGMGASPLTREVFARTAYPTDGLSAPFLLGSNWITSAATAHVSTPLTLKR